MNLVHRLASLAAFILLATTSLIAHADSLQINGIAPFDTNLGTLTQATVILDAVPVQTDAYETGFDTIGTHTHIVNPAPVLIAGFDTFTFAPNPTSASSSGIFDTHTHIANPLASQKNYSGAGLGWFLNPANVPINSVPIPTFPTANSEGHTHLVHLAPIVPRTTFTFDPAVPEPSSLLGLTLGGLMVLCRRRRCETTIHD